MPTNLREMDVLWNQPSQTTQPHSTRGRFKELDHVRFALKLDMCGRKPSLMSRLPWLQEITRVQTCIVWITSEFMNHRKREIFGVTG